MAEKLRELQFSKEIGASPTTIDGLMVWDLTVHGDPRGWFKENWQREKMVALGLEDFGPIQNNISFNTERGVTRGLHAEPWDKWISLGSGRIFGAWCDLREGSPTFGKLFSCELDPTKAIFVPRGVANGFQSLESNTVYTYLVNDHWSPDGHYAFVNLADPMLGIQWPIPLESAIVSDKDKLHPQLKDAATVPPKKVIILGAGGQLGRELQAQFPDAEALTRADFDITSSSIDRVRRWRDYGVVINAAAYTNVDGAELAEGRTAAWRVNAQAPAQLARICCENNITLVHVSSDYVFDGRIHLHPEDEPFSPLSVYGSSKAAGDVAVASVPRHYLVRTSWVVGDGNNFVRTMASLAKKDIEPQVVGDQIGRPTFTSEIARAIAHLITVKAAYGTYNVTNGGASTCWSNIARIVYDAVGKENLAVNPVSTEIYFANKPASAPRPLQSTLALDKIPSTGFTPRNWEDDLREYIQEELS